MKMMINFSRIKARFCFELQAFKKPFVMYYRR